MFPWQRATTTISTTIWSTPPAPTTFRHATCIAAPHGVLESMNNFFRAIWACIIALIPDVVLEWICDFMTPSNLRTLFYSFGGVSALWSMRYYLLDLVTYQAELRTDDMSFHYLLYWLDQNQERLYVRALRVQNDPNGGRGRRDRFGDHDQYSEDEEDDDLKGVGYESPEMLALAATDFDSYWEKRMTLDRSLPLRFVPGSTCAFMYKGRPFTVQRSDVKTTDSNGWNVTREVFKIRTTSKSIIKDFFDEAQKLYVHRQGHDTVIFTDTRAGWQRVTNRSPRSIDTIVLDQQQKSNLIADLKEYLHPLTKKWYHQRGIPYRRGYIFSGPPGTGKTSCVLAIAGMLNLSVFIVSMSSKSLGPTSLRKLFTRIPARSILLMEDIDASPIVNKRTTEPKHDLTTEAGRKHAQEEEAEEARIENEERYHDPLPRLTASGQMIMPHEEDRRQAMNLSHVLNALDGVMATEGRISIMTTNHIERLDPALLRPGRIDISVRFGLITYQAAEAFFLSFYTAEGFKSNHAAIQEYTRRKLSSFDYPETENELKKLARSFAKQLPENEISPAELQGYLLRYKYRPDKAITNVATWLVELRHRKAYEDQGEKMFDNASAAPVPSAKTPPAKLRARSRKRRVE